MSDLVKALHILNVSPNDDAQTIRSAWRALVRTYRPDMARRDPLIASKKLADINTAFEAVRAAESGDLAKLRAEIEERARKEEQKRQEALIRRTKMQKQRDTQRTNGSEKDTVAIGQAATDAHARDYNVDVAAAVERAEKGFLEAMDVCSLLRFVRVRSSYS